LKKVLTYRLWFDIVRTSQAAQQARTSQKSSTVVEKPAKIIKIMLLLGRDDKAKGLA
jgi:hypothetical protein